MAQNSQLSGKTVEQLLDEINLYQALCNSYSDTSATDQTLGEIYRTNLINLRRELEILQPIPRLEGAEFDTSNAAAPAYQLSNEIKAEAYAPPSLKQPDHGNYFSNGFVNMGEQDDPFAGIPQYSGLAYGVPSASSSHHALLDHNTPLLSRKRVLSFGEDYSSSQKRRPASSPAISTPNTPSSSSEWDGLMASLLGSDVKEDMKDYEREQREWEDRKKQEIRDAEYARSVQAAWNTTDNASTPQFPSQKHGSWMDAWQNNQRQYQAPVKSEMGPPVKYSSSRQEQKPVMPGSYPLTILPRGGGDSSNSSDLEEISPSAFVPRVKPEFSNSTSQLLSSLTTLEKQRVMDMSRLSPNNHGLPLSGLPGSSSHPSLYDMRPNSPAKTHEELKTLLANITPDDESGPGTRGDTPEAMKCTLMEHQKVGLTWMQKMEEGSKGGILADDMGLGKTVQALALIVSRPSTDPACKTTLIVAPVALLGQWKREIASLIKPGRHSLTVETLHATHRNRQFASFRDVDVVLTTFGTLASEMKRRMVWDEKKKKLANAEPSRAECLPLLGEQAKWYRVILDEAQWIKNRRTKSAIAACSLKAKFRWCLTGTPMQNNVEELHSLIQFLRVRPYNSWDNFNRDFAKILKSKSVTEKRSKEAMRQLQALCKAVMLRRTKTAKIDGKPIIQLPEKTIEQVHVVFSKDELDFYKALETQAQITFNKYLRAGTVGRNYSNALVLLLRLRQACNHPHLIKDIGLESNAAGKEGIDRLANAQTLPLDVIERIKEIEAFECPICMDAAVNSLIFNPCGHPTCNECFDRLETQARDNVDNEAGSRITCPSCRGEVDPARLTDIASFNKAFGITPEGGLAADITVPNAESTDDSEDESESDEDGGSDVDERGNIRDFVVPDDYEENGKRPAKKQTESEWKKIFQKKASAEKKGKGRAKAKPFEHLTLAQLRREGLRNKAAKKRYLKKLEKDWQTSAKIDKAVEILEAIEGRGGHEKTIVFSQFTSLLDLLEVPLARRGLNYKRYDGSMKPAEREEAVIAFSDDPHFTIILVSLKAGNSGLNLTAASQVILFDPHWNWYTEAQAIDRAHRIGQTRPVQVHRLLVGETVEDRILTLQEQKKELVETALDENAAKAVSRLGTRELGYLFGVNSLQ